MFLHGLEAKSLEDAYPSDDMLLWRSQISASDFFKFTVASDAVNLSVTLLRNKEDFAWLGARDEQDKIVKLFRFLSEEDVLSVLYFIHSTKCSRAFTADYISENSGISVERVSVILRSFCEVGDCRCMTAHLADGVLMYMSATETALSYLCCRLPTTKCAEALFINTIIVTDAK